MTQDKNQKARTDNMKAVFQIFKEGVTTLGWVTILKVKGQPYNVEAKKAFYTYLGYQVRNVK